MGIFKKRLTVNEAINAAHTSENAIIIDCRAKEDYQKGHVAGTKNIPLDKITEDRILRRFPDKEKSFLYYRKLQLPVRKGGKSI